MEMIMHEIVGCVEDVPDSGRRVDGSERKEGPPVPNAVGTAETSACKQGRETRMRLLVSDPVQLIRQGIRRVLAGQRDIVIIGEEEGGPRTAEAAAKLLPDVVFLGVDRLWAETLEIVEQIDRRVPGCRVVLLADDATVANLLEAAGAGAGGLVPRMASVHHLAETVRTAAKGEWPLEPRLLGELLVQLTSGGRPIPDLAPEALHPG
ncbi:unnamed protein product, partial [marine sediment metagenome]